MSTSNILDVIRVRRRHSREGGNKELFCHAQPPFLDSRLRGNDVFTIPFLARKLSRCAFAGRPQNYDHQADFKNSKCHFIVNFREYFGEDTAGEHQVCWIGNIQESSENQTHQGEEDLADSEHKSGDGLPASYLPKGFWMGPGREEHPWPGGIPTHQRE